MKKSITLLFLISVAFFLTACSTQPKKDETSNDSKKPVETVISPATPDHLSVNGEAIKIEGQTLLKVGDTLVTNTQLTAPTATFDTMESITLEQYKGWKVISTVPSLDTPTCSLQTGDIDKAASDYFDVNFITISADLPFALQRYCGSNDIENIHIFSDYATLDFAKQNHFLMTDFGLLARSIMVVDENNIVQYIEYANDVVDPISISDALNFLTQNKS